MRLHGKNVLITGGGTGIGRETAMLFAREGARVVVMGRRKAPLEETARAIQDEGGTALAAAGDVSKPADARRAVARVIRAFGSLDVLVNNAAAYVRKPFPETSLADWERIQSVNVRGAFLMCRAALPAMVRRKTGAIVNLSSVSGLKGFPLQSAYGPSKAAIIQFTRNLAAEYGPLGIRVNCVCPGMVRTPLTADFFSHPETVRALSDRWPLRRAGTPADVAPAIAFLASDEARWITGAVLVVDGGANVT